MIGADGSARMQDIGRELFEWLESLLREMREGRQPDSSFLFPSAQRGSDIHARSLRESFRLVRRALDCLGSIP